MHDFYYIVLLCINHLKHIATHKGGGGGIHIIFFLFVNENILEAPHIFLLRNKKDVSIFFDEKSALSVAMWNRQNGIFRCESGTIYFVSFWPYWDCVISSWPVPNVPTNKAR